MKVRISVVVIPFFGGVGIGFGILTVELELDLLELGPKFELAPLLKLVPPLELDLYHWIGIGSTRGNKFIQGQFVKK